MQNPFDAPVPGESLTSEPGAMPFEGPPEFTDPEKAIRAIMMSMFEQRKSHRLLALLESGVPVEGVVRGILFAGFMEGKWSPDLAIIIAPVVTGMIMNLADAADIDVQLQMKPKIVDNVIFDLENIREEMDEESLDDPEEDMEEETIAPPVSGGPSLIQRR